MLSPKSEMWSRLSVWTLLLSNLIPLYGVLVHDWDVFPIMLLFWSENVVIGVMNVARMLVVQPPKAEPGVPFEVLEERLARET